MDKVEGASVATGSPAGRILVVDKAVIAPGVAVRRPHRADARRNFDSLLVAAREAFAQNGTGASLEDIGRLERKLDDLALSVGRLAAGKGS